MEPTTKMPTHHRPRGNSSAKWIGGGILIAVLFATGLVPKLSSEKALAAATQKENNAEPEVEFVLPHIAAANPLLLPGSIQAISNTAIQARTSGYVKKLNVDIGSRVRAGQVLAELESPDADQQVAQANADTAKSQATVGQSIADVAKSQAGVSQSRADLLRQQAAIKQAEAALAGTKAKLSQAIAAKDQAEAKAAQSRQGVELQRANLTQAKAQLELAGATVKRYESLLKEGFVSQQDYDQSAATFKTTTASVQASQANVQAAEADVRASDQAIRAAEAVVQSAKSDADAAKANIEAARAAYRALSSNVAAAEANVQASQQNVSANRAAVESSAANARRYQVLRSFQQVVAPFDGVITSRNVDLGSLVSPGTLTAVSNSTTTPSVGLFGIARVDTLKILVNVPQTDFRSIKDGTRAEITIREFPGVTFQGTVSQSAGALDASSRTLLTEIHINNHDGKLVPGMFAQVSIMPEGAKQVLRVPANTVTFGADGTRVAVVDASSTVHYHKVTLGRDFGTEFEIVEGVQPTDHLVTNPSDDLKDGSKVKATQAVPESAKGGNAPPPPASAAGNASAQPTKKDGKP